MNTVLLVQPIMAEDSCDEALRQIASPAAAGECEDARMTGFDAVVRVARLALQSSGEGVETLERYVARAGSAYDIAVDVVVLPEQILIRGRTRGQSAIWR